MNSMQLSLDLVCYNIFEYLERMLRIKQCSVFGRGVATMIAGKHTGERVPEVENNADETNLNRLRYKNGTIKTADVRFKLEQKFPNQMLFNFDHSINFNFRLYSTTRRVKKVHTDKLVAELSAEKVECNLLERLIASSEKTIASTEKTLADMEKRVAGLETEVLSLRHKLNCRGIIERFETFKISVLYQVKLPRTAAWEKLLSEDKTLKRKLCDLEGFPPGIKPSLEATAVAKLIGALHKRLSNQRHMDESGEAFCIIKKDFCSEWEIKFLEFICQSIPIRYEIR